MLCQMKRAGPCLFDLQRRHRTNEDALPDPLRTLLHGEDDDGKTLWSHELFTHICNLLDVFGPGGSNDVAMGTPEADGGVSTPEPQQDTSSKLMGFNELTKKLQTRHVAPVVHAASWLQGFFDNLDATLGARQRG